jgi:hypothetical protein
MSTEDRRAPGATRIPFDGLVEVGGALGPSFEAQAVNVSEDGIQLRTAYLPETGQPLTCRFDGGPGQSVLASGEVVWAQGADKGGEFAVRFTDMDAESVDSLKRICGVGEHAQPVLPGSKVRLHIEGLASPMRAKIKDAHSTAVTVGSDLGFLQVGRQLELEDAQSGSKRPANIDRVEVAIDPASQVPQLVVTLRYADVQASGDSRPAPVVAGASAAPAMADDLGAVEEASIKMRGAFARSAARVGPALGRLARRAKTTVALLAKRRGERLDGSSAASSQRGRDWDEAAQRRTTAPAPGGGLHTSGRRVVRGETASLSGEEGPPPKLGGRSKRRVVVATAVMAAAIAGAIAIKKSHHEAGQEAAAVAPAENGATTAASAAESSTGASTVMPGATSTLPHVEPIAAAAPPRISGSASAADDGDSSSRGEHKKHSHVAPFGNGPVHHGNVLHLKMDGPVEALEGAQQPTGFTVKIPGRRSLEAAAPLAARDSRIAAIKISNDPAGAELTLAFKDGVPNYQVSAKGDMLAISLAPAGMLDETVAKKDEKGGKSPKHGKHEHDGHEHDGKKMAEDH